MSHPLRDPLSLITDQYAEYANVKFEFLTTTSKHILLNNSDKIVIKLLLRLTWKWHTVLNIMVDCPGFQMSIVMTLAH